MTYGADPRLRLRFARGGSSSGENGTFEVINPATGSVLAEVADMGSNEVHAAVEAAHTTFPHWAATPARERARLLMRWHDAVLAEKAYLAALMCAAPNHPQKRLRIVIR